MVVGAQGAGQAPEKADLWIYQGDDYKGTVTVTDTAGTPPAQIIAGYTAHAQIRCGRADENPQVVVEIATAVNSPNIALSIPHAQIAGLKGPVRMGSSGHLASRLNTVHLSRHPAPNHALSERGVEWFLP